MPSKVATLGMAITKSIGPFFQQADFLKDIFQIVVLTHAAGGPTILMQNPSSFFTVVSQGIVFNVIISCNFFSEDLDVFYSKIFFLKKRQFFSQKNEK